MSYNKIDVEKGQEMAPYIWNVFLDKDPELFVTPYGNRELRYRCIFDRDHTIYLHLNNKEIKEIFDDLVRDIDEIYLYGAFNQTYVKQIKILGKLSVLNSGGIIWMAIHDRLKYGENGNDELKLKPSHKEVTKALADLKEGVYLKFTPISYELGEYETG